MPSIRSIVSQYSFRVEVFGGRYSAGPIATSEDGKELLVGDEKLGIALAPARSDIHAPPSPSGETQRNLLDTGGDLREQGMPGGNPPVFAGAGLRSWKTRRRESSTMMS